MLIKIDHECDDGLMLQLTFEYTPGYPETRYQRNGDPGEPGQPDIVELFTVQFIGEDGKLMGEPWKTWPVKWGKTMEDMYEDDVIEAARDA